MNFLDKMERKFGRYAISNLSIYIIITYAAGYLLTALAPNVVSYLVLEPALILRGQIWRLVTWLLIPPGSLDLFTIITLMFYYSIGSSLERTWGAFRYNVYIFSGILMSIVGSFILYFIFGGGTTLLLYTGTVFSTYYISMSEYAGIVHDDHSAEGKMAGNRLCGTDAVGYDYRRLGRTGYAYLFFDELYYILLYHKKYEPL